MVGRVVSTKMQNTAVVLVEGRKTHPLYKKSYVRSKRYLAHDTLSAKEGDVVILVKVAPISKNKHWNITKILGQDIVSMEQAELQESAQEAIEEVMPVEEEMVESGVESLESSEVKKPVKSEKKEKASAKKADKVEKTEKPKKVSAKKEKK